MANLSDEEVLFRRSFVAKANCATCSLTRHFAPAVSTGTDDARIAIVMSSPSRQDSDYGRMATDADAILIRKALSSAGIPQHKVKFIPMISCFSPDMGRELRLARKQDKKAAKDAKGKNVVLSAPKPVTCSPLASCRPRFEEDLVGFKYIIALGDLAARYFNGGNRSIDDLRGSMQTDILGRKIAYAWEPWRFRDEPRLSDVFTGDIAKAVRFFAGRLDWKDPEIVICQSVEQIRTGLSRLSGLVTVDCEAFMGNPLWNTMKCITFSTNALSILVPWFRVESNSYYWAGMEREVVRELLVGYLTKPPQAVKLGGHNSDQYDWLLLFGNYGIQSAFQWNSILLSLLADNESRHGLGFLGSVLTDFPEAWKADHTATAAGSDLELWTYCAKDGAVTSSIVPKLMAKIKERRQEHLIPREHILAKLGQNMTRLGMKIDSVKSKALCESYEERNTIAEASIRQIVKDDDFNPRSYPQVGEILFDKWKLNPVSYSEDSGEPSTGDDDLRVMLINYKLAPEQKQFIELLRSIRKYSKKLGVLRTFIPHTQTYTTPGGEKVPGILDANWRVHPSYNRLPSSGRYSSSDPNWQNQDSEIRSCVIPGEGHVFVGCDANQLELRYICEEAGAMRLIGTMLNQLCPHNETMEIVYGPGIWQMEGAPKDRTKKGTPDSVFYNTRGVTKNIRYAWQYRAGVHRVWEQVTSAEDDKGRLLYADVTEAFVRTCMKGLNRADPEIPLWWKKIEEDYRTHGFLADSLWGRRRYFRGRDSINERANHPIQAGGFHMVAEAMIEMIYGVKPWFATQSVDYGKSTPKGSLGNARAIDWSPLLAYDFDRQTGLVTNTHDSVVFEVEERHGPEVLERVLALMTRQRKVNPLIPYTGEGKIGANWQDV